uniref:Myb-like domain-containing protein n=1 Tax=Musa acuminata subsp. malaccensis TaxID=214687 RepID=A0A804J2J4_MUSAM
MGALSFLSSASSWHATSLNPWRSARAVGRKISTTTMTTTARKVSFCNSTPHAIAPSSPLFMSVTSLLFSDSFHESLARAEVSSSEWEFIDMSDEEVDIICRMYRLVGDRWEMIAGRVPGRTPEAIERRRRRRRRRRPYTLFGHSPNLLSSPFSS